MIKFKAIIPKGLDKGPLYQEVERVLRATGQDFESAYRRFVQSWQNQPNIVSTVKLDRNIGRGVVHTRPEGSDQLLQIIRWIIYGTEGPYPISPPQGGLLRYRGVFTPKTIPGVIPSQMGGKRGDYVFLSGTVQHPGIVARNTVQVIEEAQRPFFMAQMKQAKLDTLQ